VTVKGLIIKTTVVKPITAKDRAEKGLLNRAKKGLNRVKGLILQSNKAEKGQLINREHTKRGLLNN